MGMGAPTVAGRTATTPRFALAAYLAGQFISGTGSRVNAVALPLLVIERYGVGLSLGLVAAARLAPRVVLGPPAGALADRLPRQATLAVTNLLSAALVAAIPLTTSLARLYLLCALVGIVEAFMRPAGFALPPTVFPRRVLYRLNAWLEGLDAGTNLLGPAVAVALAGAFGVASAFRADALSFVFAALTLLPLRPLPDSDAPHQASAAVSGGFRAVVRLLREQPLLLVLLWVNITYTIGIGALLVLYAPLALRLGAGDWGYGALVTATGAGALLGVLAAPRVGPRLTPRAILVLLAGSGALLLAIGPRRAFWPLLVLLLLAHAPESLCYLAFATESQRRVPSALLGRYHGVAMTLLATALPFGSVLGGLGAAYLDLRTGVALVGAGWVFAALAGAVRGVGLR